MLKKYIFIILAILICLQCSCNRNVTLSLDGESKIYDFSLFDNANVIVPKNQTDSQSLSIIIKNNKDELIIFDGGRVEDADYLYSLISKYNKKVKAWFLTHIHDDHVGALYKILSDDKYDVRIDNIYYSFADFDWYYEKIGNEAGSLILLTDEFKKLDKTNNFDNIKKNDLFTFDNVSIKVLNNIYKLDTDPINNSSISYKVNIDKSNMIIFGDLGYRGGELLYNEIENLDDIKSDILVLSHHGQNGVPVALYYYVNPKVVIWPTSKDIYENVNNIYDTDSTKSVIDDLGVKTQILSYKETAIIK